MSASDPVPVPGAFSVPVVVRAYELDVNGHVNHANYHRYGEHARTEHLAAAGATLEVLQERGWGIVLLETHARFLSELRYAERVEVTSEITFGEGKTFEFRHRLLRSGEPDRAVAADIRARVGLIDAVRRRLVEHPRERLLEVATAPGLLA